MGDFGSILEKWESTGKKSGQQPDDASSFAAQIDRYPVVDKDVEPASAGPRRKSPDRLPVDDTIDLHGHTVPEALHATDAFITAALAAGHRKVLVIHGKGQNGQGVLRREVRAFLERHSRTGAMGYPKGADGGRGALWVVLRYEDEKVNEPIARGR